MLFDEQQFDLESYLYELKFRIEKRSNFLLELTEKWREIYQNQINQYSEIFKNIHQEITTEFQLLNQQIEIFVKFVIVKSMNDFYLLDFSSKDPDPVKAEYYFQEINDFNRKLRQRNKQIEKYSNQSPTYSIPNFDPSILGTISLQKSIEHIKLRIIDDNTEQSKIVEEEEEEDDAQSTDSDQTIHESHPTTSPLTTLEHIPNKKLLWSLHFKFVPQYISLYRQSILFASDRWGFVR